MKPLNREEKGCNYTSSDCVIWQGPDIPCIKLCRGDSVSDVVAKLAQELCDVLETLNIDTYDISCLNLTGCAPANFHDFLQALINLICNLQECCANNGGGNSGSSTSTDAFLTQQMPVNPMYHYTNEFGDTVTTMTGRQYLTTIGNETATLDTRLSVTEVTVAQHSSQINTLQTQVDSIPASTEQLITPVCVLPAVPTEPALILQSLENQFCQLVSATGSPTEIYQNIIKQCNNLGADQTLGGGGGTMASLPGWSNTLPNLAAAFGNMWLTMCDIRDAIKNLKATCCSPECNAIELTLFGNITGSNLTLFVNGVIPVGYANCLPTGAPVTITDDTGGSMTATMDIVTFLNNPSGYTIPLPTPPINLSSNINIKIDACLYNASIGTTCQRILQYTVVNVINCPTMTYLPTTDSIAYTGPSSSGTNTYTIELWNSLGTAIIASQVQVVANPAPINGNFAGLTINTNYLVRVKVTSSSGVETICAFTPVSLLPTTILPVPLGSSSSFVALAGGGITETSGSGGAFVGDVGSDPVNTITGILPANVTGVLYAAPSPVVVTAKIDVTNAIADAAGRTGFTTIPDAIGGTVITPGVYHTTGNTVDLTGSVTFDALGDPSAVFIIFVTGNITIDTGATMAFAGSANWNNIFFVSDGGMLILGAGATVSGNFIVHGDVDAAANADVHGRVFSEMGIQTLNNPTFYNV